MNARYDTMQTFPHGIIISKGKSHAPQKGHVQTETVDEWLEAWVPCWWETEASRQQTLTERRDLDTTAAIS